MPYLPTYTIRFLAQSRNIEPTKFCCQISLHIFNIWHIRGARFTRESQCTSCSHFPRFYFSFLLVYILISAI